MSNINAKVEITNKCAATKSFNFLPVEIIKEIFCIIGNPYLFDLKTICWFWYNLIQDILHIQVIQVPSERYLSAVNTFDNFDLNDDCVFKICQLRYTIHNVICRKIIYDQTGWDLQILCDSSYLDVFDMLEYAARKDTSRTTSKDATGAAWRIIIAMTGINCSVDQLRNKSNTANEGEAKSLLRNYRWYTYKVDEEYSAGGIIALYPNSRTFAIFQGVLSDDSDYDHDYYPYHDDYYNDYFYYGDSDYEWY